MTRKGTRQSARVAHKRFFEPVILLLAVCLFALMQYVALIGVPSSSELRVWYFDVGQGDATLIEFPSGERLLIDAGRDQTVLQKVGTVLPPWSRRIDAILITHPDADHITGFAELLDRYQVDTVYSTGADAYTEVMDVLDDAIAHEQAQEILLSQGDTLFFEDVVLEVLWPEHVYNGEAPEDRNNASLVTKLTYGDTTIIFSGDAEAEAEAGFGALAGDVDVLNAGHHGSLTSSTVSYLDNVAPEQVIISAGFENRYGHPHPVVLERLEAIHAEIFRTDVGGDILLTSTGGEPVVRYHPLPY